MPASPGEFSGLVAPLNEALGGKGAFYSWRDAALNEVLWAALIRCYVDQNKSLKIFRNFILSAEGAEKDSDIKNLSFLTHSANSILTDHDFDLAFKTIIEDEDAQSVLPALLLLDCLPDRHHWLRHLPAPNPEIHFKFLMKAVAGCLDHQSQESTDIRWLKVCYFAIVCKKLRLPSTVDFVTQLRFYPNYGDQRSVRPAIRALEISLRAIDDKTNPLSESQSELLARLPNPWNSLFWSECFRATPCIPPNIKKSPLFDSNYYRQEFLQIFSDLSTHFLSTLENTDLDPERDSAFGLVLYAVVLGLGALHNRAEGRIILRTIVEVFIVLKFLSHHRNPTFWAQFRNHGNGKSKLAFLKNLRSTEIPDFVSIDDLERYANEDVWQEFQDIDLKSWSSRNLREMAQDANVKDVYDTHYDWSSGYVHANWSNIRDTLFCTCLNPLHRYHRIPFVPRLDMPTVLPDIAKLINRSLDVIAELFPVFKSRVKHPPKDDETCGGSSENSTIKD